MRVECESCRELVVASFVIEADAVRARCPACHHVTSVAAAAAADPFAPHATEPADTASCPKCGAARRDDATACSTCGLAVARMAAYSEARDAAVAAPVRTAWSRASAAWDDDARHDAVFQLAATHNAYAWAAGRYRTRGHEPIAQRQLERLRRAAEATLLAGATARVDAGKQPYRATAGVLVALVVIAGAGLLYAMVSRERRTATRAHVMPAGAPASDPTAPDPGGAPGTVTPAGTVRPLVPGHPVSSSTIK